MGTNYYAVKSRPTTCSPIHIGKSSSGWLFCFHQVNDSWHDPPIVWNTYEQVKEWLYKYTIESPQYVILDEYDEQIPFDQFFDMVDGKQNDKKCRGNKDNFTYCRNVNGYRFDDREFC